MISVAPTTTFTTIHSDCKPSEFILPDLFNDCHYPLQQNPHCYPVSRASEQWLLNSARLEEPKVTAFMGLLAGELGAAIYPGADAFHLRVCADFLNWLFTMDDWLDECDVDGAMGMRECCISAFRDPINFQTDKLGGMMCKSYFSRFRETGGHGCTERFIHRMNLFFIAVAKQADDRTNGHVPDLETYIAMRRNTGGCLPCFTLIEYAAQIDLPDEVMSHPVILAMEEAANDHICWTNDIFSYNVEQARHDPHSIVTVLMHEQGLDLQSAMDYSGKLCNGTIQRFEDNRAILPSWGEEIDREVAIYVGGLQDWITGALHWSFVSTRYFGKDGNTVKRDRIIKLLPQMPL
ncbi:isoprenoid synthase domain-containing protein [Suillus lakei]|nr:isoprenoid synthase domain-containing protein [Suillus lakei]